MTSPSPALDALRLQLEGQWELLEQAQARETQLLQQLGSRRWKQHQARWVPLLGEARAAESPLQAVVTYVAERAAREQWPRNHPGLAALDALRTRRAALNQLLHRRLDRPAPREALPFTTLLEHLEARALEPEPAPPSPEELLLTRGWGLSGAGPVRYWLLAKRLLWKPWRGAPAEVKLASLSPADVSLASRSELLVDGTRRLQLNFFRHAQPLATLLEACREVAPAPAPGLDDDAVVLSPASFHSAGFSNEPRFGVAIFRPQHVTFVPTHRPSLGEHLRRWLTTAIPVAHPTRLLWHEAALEHLRRLPPERFDEAVAALCQLQAGQHWPGAEVQRPQDTLEALRFTCHDQVLSIPRARLPPLLRPFLERHLPHLAAAVEAPTPGPGSFKLEEGSLGWYRALIVVGSCFFLPYRLLGNSEFNFPGDRLAYGVSYLLLAWLCMRYAKAQGRSPLWGLAGSTCGLFGAVLVLAIPGKRRRLRANGE